MGRSPELKEAAECEWAEVTSDWAYTVLARLGNRKAPDEDDPTQRNWTQLACDLVDDIRGVETRDYLFFRDGWIYQKVIDVVRAAAGWTRIDGA